MEFCVEYVMSFRGLLAVMDITLYDESTPLVGCPK